jgi:hypothetical protein
MLQDLLVAQAVRSAVGREHRLIEGGVQVVERFDLVQRQDLRDRVGVLGAEQLAQGGLPGFQRAVSALDGSCLNTSLATPWPRDPTSGARIETGWSLGNDLLSQEATLSHPSDA